MESFRAGMHTGDVRKGNGRVSVVITTHNRRRLAIRAIKSVLFSERPEDILEIIVVDDASTDATSEAISREVDTKLIRVIKNESEKLVSESRNRGLRESRGEYVFFIDDDVVLHSQTIASLVDFLSSNVHVG